MGKDDRRKNVILTDEKVPNVRKEQTIENRFKEELILEQKEELTTNENNVVEEYVSEQENELAVSEEQNIEVLETEVVDEQQQIQEIYAYAIELKKKGFFPKQMREKLVERGLDEASARVVVQNIEDEAARQRVAYQAEAESGGVPRWLIYIVILIGINILSAIFDWNFWIY